MSRNFDAVTIFVLRYRPNCKRCLSPETMKSALACCAQASTVLSAGSSCIMCTVDFTSTIEDNRRMAPITVEMSCPLRSRIFVILLYPSTRLISVRISADAIISACLLSAIRIIREGGPSARKAETQMLVSSTSFGLRFFDEFVKLFSREPHFSDRSPDRPSYFLKGYGSEFLNHYRVPNCNDQ